jgi:SAM-dependent MidA family methyltransferase
MGLIAFEVARAFASDDLGIKQIFQTLSNSETDLFKRMDVETRVKWLIEKWGFGEEFEVLKKELTAEK